MSILIAVGVMLVLAGLALAAAALAGIALPQPGRPRRRRPGSGRESSRRWRPEQLAAVPAGILALLLTGWVAAGLGAAAAVLVAPSLVRPTAASQRHIARLGALASWARRLADLLASGAAQTLQDGLARAALASPTPIREQTRALATRIGPHGLEPALRQFARDIADPVGDHVAMALIVRARHGGAGLADVLSALAVDVDEQVRMRRGILAEQHKAVANIRMILAVTAGFWVLLALFARPYLAPYHSVAGQVALTVIVAGFAATIGWLRRLSRPVLGARLLPDPNTDPTAAPATHPGFEPTAGPASGTSAGPGRGTDAGPGAVATR